MNTKPWYQKILGSSWGTSLTGILGAAMYLFVTQITSGVKPKDAVNACIVLALGLLAKQFNKSNAPNPLPDAETTPPIPFNPNVS